MDHPSRRQYLAGVAAAAGLAGCLGGSGSGGGETATGLALDAVDVEGSPGGTVPVKPAGKPALVDFFATWCAPCKPQMAELRAVADRFPDLHLVSITRETDREEIRQFWREYDGTWPVATDPELEARQAYTVDDSVPTKVLLTADGEKAWTHTGLAAADTIADEIEGIR